MEENTTTVQLQAEFAEGRKLVAQQRSRIVFQIERFIEAHGLSPELELRLKRNHFGFSEDTHDWIRNTDLDRLVQFAGIIGMDVTDISMTLQPV